LNGLTSNRIQVFHKQNNGTLWYGAERAGLGYYDVNKDKFVNISENLSATVDKSTVQLLRKAAFCRLPPTNLITFMLAHVMGYLC
jgi:hypothetical protein